MKMPHPTIEIPDELIAANREAILKPEEIKVLMEGCRRSVQRLENVVWSEIERTARLQLRRE